jgi:hypothetical protein
VIGETSNSLASSATRKGPRDRRIARIRSCRTDGLLTAESATVARARRTDDGPPTPNDPAVALLTAILPTVSAVHAFFSW